MNPEPYDPLRIAPDSFANYRDVDSALILGQPVGPKTPRVSIVIPTYRRAALLSEAVRSALGQVGFDDYEVIVVDNDAEPQSSDTEQMLQGLLVPRLRYYRNRRNIGMTANWNRGIELARGEWFTMLHDDDWLAPQFLERMFGNVPADAQIMFCKSQIGQLGYSPEHLRSQKRGHDRLVRVHQRQYVLGNISPAPGILVRKSRALAIGGYDPSMDPCVDYDYNLRASLRGGAYQCRERLSYYRTTDSETFKGDTFERLIVSSAWIKKGLLRQAPSIRSSIYYVDSMKTWYRTAARLQRRITVSSTLDRIALRASTSNLASRVLKIFSRFIGWLDRDYAR